MIWTLRILEDYLDTFQGIVIVVSHDRYFLDRTVRRIFSFEGDGVLVQHEGGYTDYANRKKWETEDSSARNVTGSKIVKDSRNSEKAETNGSVGNRAGDSAADVVKSWKSGQKCKLKFTYQEQKDYESIEGEMAVLEEQIKQIDADYLKYSKDFVKLNELAKQKEEAEALLEEKMDRWMYLEELAARIEKGETIDI